MIEPPEFDPSTIQDIVIVIQNSTHQEPNFSENDRQRDQYGRVIVNETELNEVLKGIHEHEGAKALYDRCRLIIFHPKLRQKCQDYVRACAIRQVAKYNTIAAQILKDDNHINLPCTRPFETMHMDVLGPFSEEDGYDRKFVITMICRVTRFAVIVPTFQCPTAEDAIKTFGLVLVLFHTTPDAVMVDEGSQFRALFSAGIEKHRTRNIPTAVKASFSNGRIERLYRVINDKIRAKELEGGLANMNQFSSIVRRATLLHNTQHHSAIGCTPHEMIFTFQSWIYPDLKKYRTQEKLDFEPIVPDKDKQHPLASRKLPEEGEVWLWRKPSHKKKESPFMPCKIVTRLSTQTYRIRIRSGKQKQAHLRHLKWISPEAAANIPEQIKIPEDPRPLRDLKSSRREGACRGIEN